MILQGNIGIVVISRKIRAWLKAIVRLLALRRMFGNVQKAELIAQTIFASMTARYRASGNDIAKQNERIDGACSRVNASFSKHGVAVQISMAIYTGATGAGVTNYVLWNAGRTQDG